jgi:hypothetical protein
MPCRGVVPDTLHTVNLHSGVHRRYVRDSASRERVSVRRQCMSEYP